MRNRIVTRGAVLLLAAAGLFLTESTDLHAGLKGKLKKVAKSAAGAVVGAVKDAPHVAGEIVGFAAGAPIGAGKAAADTVGGAIDAAKSGAQEFAKGVATGVKAGADVAGKIPKAVGTAAGFVAGVPVGAAKDAADGFVEGFKAGSGLGGKDGSADQTSMELVSATATSSTPTEAAADGQGGAMPAAFLAYVKNIYGVSDDASAGAIWGLAQKENGSLPEKMRWANAVIRWAAANPGGLSDASTDDLETQSATRVISAQAGGGGVSMRSARTARRRSPGATCYVPRSE